MRPTLIPKELETSREAGLLEKAAVKKDEEMTATTIALKKTVTEKAAAEQAPLYQIANFAAEKVAETNTERITVAERNLVINTATAKKAALVCNEAPQLDPEAEGLRMLQDICKAGV